jgi:HAL2 family 3'(2'),5'-bisphosphate nucleotidase
MDTRLNAAIQAVRKAARVTAHVQAALDDVRAMTKDDHSPVTVADLASQAVVASMLSQHLEGELVLVGEEDSDFLRQDRHDAHLSATLAAARLVLPDLTRTTLLDAIDLGNGKPNEDGFWTLDPVDGTKGFLRGQQYAIALAWIEDGRPTLAVMACPNLSLNSLQLEADELGRGCLFYATVDDATRCRGLNTDATDSPVRCTPITRPLVVCGSVEKAHSNTGWMGRSLTDLQTSGCSIGPSLPMDSQAKYAVVARGQADAYLRLPSKPGYIEHIWDHAAGSLIAQQAGAIVTDIDGKPLDFSHGAGLETNRGVVCASPAVHAKIIESIRKSAQAVS